VTRILIIEDEAHAAIRLEKLLKEIEPDFELLAIIDSVKGAVDWLTKNPSPDLVMLDIQLGDGMSFEIFKQISIDAFVIFTTAFDQYAIKAFELNSIDYLLKPIDKARLKLSLEKFHQLQHRSNKDEIALMLEKLDTLQNNYKKRFIVAAGENLKRIETSEIAYFYSMEKASFLCTFGNRHYAIEYALDALEDLLNPADFFRVNRQYLLHHKAIQSISLFSKSRLKLKLNPEANSEVLVSSTRTPQFRKWLDS
jgi:DNA-binding LytR/AlgR family response regulator